jgi:8-amino-7-oxononanoate synthase
MKDIFEKTRTFTRAKEAMEMGLYPFFQPLEDSDATTAIFKGKEVVMIGSNNYLGLTTDPRVKRAAAEALEKYGTSCTGSRFLNGTLRFHLELDQRLAKFVGKEAAIVFSTGYLASVLSKLPDDAGKLVVVDGVYSMGGDIAPLPELVEICKQYGARIMVDDAHSLGVLAKGHGTAAHFGLTDEVDLIMGTFSKSFASIGGFIAGSEPTIHYIQHFARSFAFSASLPASNAAAVLAALDIIESEPEHVQRLWDNAEYMRAGLKQLGYDTGTSNTPVIPLMVREDYRTVLAWHALIEQGVYTNPVISPGVPPGNALLRTSYMATHTKEHLDRALHALEIVGHNLDLIPEGTTLETTRA